MKNRMNQKSGDESKNIQIGGNLTIGISASEARQIALDVFKANFYEFSEKATEKAVERAEEITNKFVDKFFREIPHLASKLEEPSVQSSMFNAQKEYAKTGDVQLEEHLLNILIERINSEERSLKQIALDEALVVLPKLTNEQVDILTLVFSIISLGHNTITNLNLLKYYIDSRVIKFYPKSTTSFSFFTHLQFTGCCTILSEGNTYKPLNQIFMSKFKGLFNKGFSITEFEEFFPENKILDFKNLIISCLHNPSLMQVNAMTDNVIQDSASKLNLEDKVNKFKALFDKTTMNENETKDYLISINSRIEKLFKDWDKTDIKFLRLTSVGFAIAITNYNKQTGEEIKFEKFI